MNFSIPSSSDAYYEPNSFNGPQENKEFVEPAFSVDGDGYRYNHLEESQDHYSQVADLFWLMNENQKQQLFNNIAQAMQGIPQDIIDRQIELFEKVHSDYATGVLSALNE